MSYAPDSFDPFSPAWSEPVAGARDEDSTRERVLPAAPRPRRISPRPRTPLPAVPPTHNALASDLASEDATTFYERAKLDTQQHLPDSVRRRGEKPRCPKPTPAPRAAPAQSLPPSPFGACASDREDPEELARRSIVQIGLEPIEVRRLPSKRVPPGAEVARLRRELEQLREERERMWASRQAMEYRQRMAVQALQNQHNRQLAALRHRPALPLPPAEGVWGRLAQMKTRSFAALVTLSSVGVALLVALALSNLP